MNIIIYPNDSGRNAYINIHKEIWVKSGFKVFGIKEIYKVILNRNSNVGVINWLEDRVVGSAWKSLLQFLVALLVILFMKASSKRIVYVKHNYKPHKPQTKNTERLYKILVKMLHIYSDVSCNHLKDLSLGWKCESIYISHPLYLRNMPKSSKERDIDYLIFGRIDEYKGVTGLLEHWPKDKCLFLMGKTSSDRLEFQIKEIISRRSLDVSWQNEFISDKDLNEMLCRTKFVILSHVEGSMLVSGAFYHAISFGVNVIGISNNFIEENSRKFSFVNNVSLDNLSQNLTEINYVDSCLVMEDTYSYFDDRKIIQQWSNIFNN